jgi:carbonic anhydrase
MITVRKLVGLLVLCSCAAVNNDDKESEYTPLERLLNGNLRYSSSHALHPHQDKARLNEITDEQNPFAVIISCSDSRVPPEIIFDQGLGDLFVIRTAGNVLGDLELASIEYAIHKLNCNVIMIMGHEGCGTIQTFLEQPTDSLPGHLNSLVDFIKSQPYSSAILNDKVIDKTYHGVISNVIFGINYIKKESTVIRKKYEDKELELVGAIYHLNTGKVQVITDDIRK